MGATSPSSGNGGTAANDPVVPCPLRCPTDFNIVAERGKILKVGDGWVALAAREQPGIATGNYTWTTNSTKIRLTNANTPIVTVHARGTAPSTARDAEVITVTRRVPNCPPLTKTVNVTVAKVKFSAATNQKYGYDNNDTPGRQPDDHVCLKKLDNTTVKVEIEGGALGTDFNFVCDNAGFCTTGTPGGTAAFDVQLNAGTSATAARQDTVLHAKTKTPDATSFASIKVNIYQEKVVNVVVGKFFDTTVAATTLRFANQNYASFQADINNKLKEAVVKFNLSNFAANPTNVRYDLDGNGALTYDIKNSGGNEFLAIRRAFTAGANKTRVAVVRNMKSYYYLSAAAAVGDTSVRVTASSVFDYPAGFAINLGPSTNQESVTVASKTGNQIVFSAALTRAHAAGEPLEFPAAGWSTDPILIIEGSASINDLKWTIPHEVGHSALGLKDVEDTTNCMHYAQGGSDYRLRYCPRRKHYEAGTENQWQTIRR